MLFDLRVVLAACLATFIFVAAGLGLMSGLRSPFKASAEGPRMAGPGLPQTAPLPLPETARGEEITGTVADQRMTPEPAAPQERVQESAQEKAQEKEQEKAQEKGQEKGRVRETRAAPAKGKKQTITSLIEEDTAAHPAPAAKPKAKRRRVHPRQVKQQPQSANPFTTFMNNNRQGATAPATTTR